VPDHVGVGEVDDDDVEGGVVDCLDNSISNTRSGHLRREVVSCHLLRGDEDAVFAGEGLLDASVEEVGDVSVLLCLGDAEIAEVGIGHDVGEEVFHRLRWNDDGQVDELVVPRHADVVDVLRSEGAGNLGLELGCLGEVVAIVGGEAAGNVAVAGEDAGDLTDTKITRIATAGVGVPSRVWPNTNQRKVGIRAKHETVL